MTSAALPVVFDLAAATTFAETLRAAPGPITLDGSGVERIGIAGLQLLLSAHVSATAAGHRLTIDAASDVLRAAARTAGASFLLAPPR